MLSSQVCEACKGELPLMHLKGMGRIRWDKDVAYIEAVNQRSPRQGATSPRKGSISPPRDGASPRKDKPAGPPPSRPFPDPPGSDGRRSPRETSYRMRQATRETTKIQEAKAEDEKKKAIVEEKRRAEEAKAKAEAEKEAKAKAKAEERAQRKLDEQKAKEEAAARDSRNAAMN